MVTTQLQLKWPNHSTYLLTGLKSLFQNEQLVDCTLKCNKHTLKVHRSVLAACSPYFERELENTPSIVINDMQFNVLQALIEFMYYGETRISEENLKSLIEAAKLFEVKGLSDMDLFSSTEANVVSSMASMNGSCMVQNGLVNMNDIVFHNNPQPNINTTHTADITQSICSNNPCSEGSEDSNSNLMTELNSSPSLSQGCRNFVVTPPQTESAQILLSLARSYDEKHQLQQSIASGAPVISNSCNMPTAVPKSMDGNSVFVNEHNFVFNSLHSNSSINTSGGTSVKDGVTDEHLSNSESLPVGSAPNNVLYVKREYNDDVSSSFPNTNDKKSLLAELLTKSPTTETSPQCNITTTHYQSVYGGEPTMVQQIVANKTNFDLQQIPPDAILDCPFLIETSEGFVDVSVENMLNVFENNEIFDSSSRMAKVLSREPVIMEQPTVQNDVSRIVDINNLELQRITQEAENELKDDPEAVVMCKVNKNGVVERCVFSSADISALKEMNEHMKQHRQQSEVSAHRSFNEVHSSHIEFEVSPSTGGAPFITRILSGGNRVENAISKLPFKKTNILEGQCMKKENNHQRNTSSILEDASLAVDSHHHENMFEELDSQFSMDCSIENIQREYVAYEEASKNETQLEHNYYANALKDEDEECVGINNYSLRAMMLIGEPTSDNLSLATLASNNSHNNSNNNNLKLKSNANPASSLNTFAVISAQDLYLNGREAEVPESRCNGQINNTKCDLIINKDALMSSVVNAASMSKSRNTKRLDDGMNKRKGASNNVEYTISLPFKKVKNLKSRSAPVGKKRRASRRRCTSLHDDSGSQNENSSNLSNGFHEEGSLVEEIIVDDIL